MLRIVQGIGVGGEWGGSVLMSMEWGSQQPARLLMASWPQLGVPLGLLLSTGMVKLMQGNTSEADFDSWGWRIPFLLSASCWSASACTCGCGCWRARRSPR